MRPESAVQREAAQLRLKVKALREQAKFAELVTEHQDHPLWVDGIRPILRNVVAGFHQSTLSMDVKDFPEERAIAKWCDWLERKITEAIGTRDGLLKEADRIEAALEQHDKTSRIRSEGSQ